MGNKSCPQLTLSFLLMAAVCLEAVSIEITVNFVPKKKTWAEAQLNCQKNKLDLVTFNTVDRVNLAKWLLKENITDVWIGLIRDPTNESVWKWIDSKPGEVSESVGQRGMGCAVVSDKDGMWYKEKCSESFAFYCSEGDTIQYHKKKLSWNEASNYCQENFGELATINQTNADQLHKDGWIGLYQNNGETWSWMGNWQSNYSNWAPQDILREGNCAYFDPVTDACYSDVCSKKLKSACYDDNLMVVNEQKTWEDALEHCLNMDTPCPSKEQCYSHNLLTLKDNADYNYVRDRIYRSTTTDEVWTGLRFLGGNWWWVSGDKLGHHQGLPDCPSQWKHCGALSKYDTNKWIIRDCTERRNFVCVRQKTIQGTETETVTKKRDD